MANLPRVERGVYRAPHRTRDGHEYFKAVTSDNRVVARVTVYEWDSTQEMARMLRRVLDRVDPVD